MVIIAIWAGWWAMVGTVAIAIAVGFHGRDSRFSAAPLLPPAVAFLLAIPVLWCSIVIGGTFGGGWGENVGVRLGFGSSHALIAIDIALGMWIVGSWPLAIIVAGIARALSRPRASTTSA